MPYNGIKDKIIKTLSKIIKILNESSLTESEIVKVLYELLYSIGYSLEKIEINMPQDILINYTEKNTLGATLMAQALFMKEKWDKENNNQLKGNDNDNIKLSRDSKKRKTSNRL